VFVGCGASVIGNIKIHDNCTIGCGSIVLKPLPAGVTAVGNPARIVHPRNYSANNQHESLSNKQRNTTPGRVQVTQPQS
jgi:serine O-acetyltransferase